MQIYDALCVGGKLDTMPSPLDPFDSVILGMSAQEGPQSPIR